MQASGLGLRVFFFASVILLLGNMPYGAAAQVPSNAPAFNPLKQPETPLKTIEVIADVTGESPKDAQEKAIDYAQKRAFFLALYELQPEKAKTIAMSLNERDLLRYVRGYEIVQDRVTDNRYQAKFNVSVSDTLIKQLASNDPLDFGAEVAPDPDANLVIPVLDTGTDLLLWDNSNIWRSIMNSVALERGEGLLVMPFGDPVDVNWVDNSTILSATHESLKQWLSRYGVSDVAIAEASYALERNPIAVEVKVRYISKEGEISRRYTFQAANPEDTPELLLIQAAGRIADEIKNEAYKRKELRKMLSRERQRQTVRVYFQRLPEWVQLRERFDTLPNIEEIAIRQIGVTQADIDLYYQTNPSMLRRSMEVRGFIVNDKADPWRVK